MNICYFLKKLGIAFFEGFRAFRLTPSPRLIMTLLVKNEEDVLEENLLFHKAMGVDGFIITDNNSTDRTPEIIRKYKDKGWVLEVIEETATNYEQKQWVDRMVWKAKTQYKADWVINADADELWYSPSGNLKDELSATRANVLKCEVKSVYPEEDRPFWEWDKMINPVLDQAKYDLSLYSIFERQNNKVIHRATCYLQISMGNHKVTMFPRKSEPARVRVYHYNIRGKRHFMEKMINGGKQLEQHSSKRGGRHWRYFYQMYKEGKLEAEYDRVIGKPVFDELCKDGYIYTDTTIPTFFGKLGGKFKSLF
ncbi:MAG: glycosyltransferase family 2 protein [Bacteroides sp.]|nr:glycosyltransferase family 2 protein [Bacteroides sp.]